MARRLRGCSYILHVLTVWVLQLCSLCTSTECYILTTLKTTVFCFFCPVNLLCGQNIQNSAHMQTFTFSVYEQPTRHVAAHTKLLSLISYTRLHCCYRNALFVKDSWLMCTYLACKVLWPNLVPASCTATNCVTKPWHKVIVSMSTVASQSS